MSDWKESISQTVGTERISEILKYVTRVSPSNESPLDDFYFFSKEVMTSATPAVINSNDWIGSLYAISIVSNTENYFRDIFTKILKMCPSTQKNAASNSINFGSVIWHPNDIVERGAFEHLSLASAEQIISTTRKYIGMDLNSTDVKSILVEFDKVCELRHGIVHSNRVLAGKNAIKLQLPPSAEITKIVVTFGLLQEMSSICTTLVVSFNQLMFETMSKRWATTWRRLPSWDSDKESAYYKQIWNSFYSKVDQGHGTIPNEETWITCKNLVKKEFNV